MATAKIKNTTSFARTGIVTLGVPFSRAYNLQESDTLVVSNAIAGVSDQEVQWYPQGVRWDNGAVKYARVSFRADLDANEEKTVGINRALTSTPIPFGLDTEALTGLLGTSISFTIQGTDYQFPIINFFTDPTLRIEGGQGNDHYGRYRYFTHLPENSNPQTKYLWMDLVIDLNAYSKYINFFVRFGYYRFYSGMSTSQGVDPLFSLSQPVLLRITGARSKIRWEDYKIPSIDQLSQTDRLYTLINPVGTDARLPMGISHCYKGVLCYGDTPTVAAELNNPILAMAEDWKYTYPITGVMPARPDYITSDQDALNRSNTLLNILQGPMQAIRAPYNWPTISTNPNNTQTGTHGLRDYAFGLRGWPFMSTTNYNWIPFLEFCTRQQATRHNWFYGTNGEPVPPDSLRYSGSNGCAIWNGTYFYLNGYFSLAGFSREIGTNDIPIAVGTYGSIYGPDKEHFTNKMFILQGLITMDWFSLEYAKMYSKYWIHANRSDSPSGSIASWGSPRATGRTYEVAAFLYEFYADSELKTHIQNRTTYNLAQPSSHFLNKTLYPGGTEIIRATQALTPCNQGACLNTLWHWRPWEEGASVLGTHLMSKCLLAENPSNTYGLRLAEISKDTSASILMKGGWLDGRTSATRRFLIFSFGSPAACNAFKAAIGPMAGQLPLTNLTTSGEGTIYMYYHNTEWGTGDYGMSRLIINLKNATGEFKTNDIIRLATGQQATIADVYDFWGGAKSRYLGDPSLSNWGRGATEEQEDILMVGGEDLGNFPTQFYPVSSTKYAYWYNTYKKVITASLPIARQAAQENYYADSNTEIVERATDYINYFGDSGLNTDNGDYQEELVCFAGYIQNNLFDVSITPVTATPIMAISSIPEATVVITPIEQANDVSVQCESSTVTIGTTDTGTSIVNSTGVRTNVPSTLITVRQFRTPPSISKEIEPQATNIYIDATNLPTVYTTSIAPGIRVLTFIYMGDPEPAPAVSAFVHETITEFQASDVAE